MSSLLFIGSGLIGAGTLHALSIHRHAQEDDEQKIRKIKFQEYVVFKYIVGNTQELDRATMMGKKSLISYILRNIYFDSLVFSQSCGRRFKRSELTAKASGSDDPARAGRAGASCVGAPSNFTPNEALILLPHLLQIQRPV